MGLLTKLSCSTAGTLERLTRVSADLSSGVIDTEEAQNRIDDIYKTYKRARDPRSFHEYMVTSGLADKGFIYEQQNKGFTQDQISLISTDNETLFRYRDTALLKFKGAFSHNVFKYLFVDTSKASMRHYTVTKTQVNNAVAALKNDLCKQLVKDLGISELEGVNFFVPSGPVVSAVGNTPNYVLLMQDPKVTAFLDEYLTTALEDCIGHPDKFNTFCALYTLNNFDSLLESEMGTLLHFDPEFKGYITNNKYIKEDTADSEDYWADDSHEGKDIKNYTSNLAKFIMQQIPKVNGVGKNATVIDGQYLTANDLYVLGHVIKQAEYEYNLMHQDNPVSLAVDTTESFRILLNSNVPAIQSAKKYVIESMRRFLYEGDGANYSIKELFGMSFESNQKILDVETIIAFESQQSCAPTYTEFDPDGMPTHKNYGGVYEGGNITLSLLTDFILAEAQNTKPTIAGSGNEYKDFPEFLDSKKKIDSVNFIMTQILGFDLSHELVYKDFSKAHKSKGLLVLLNKLRYELGTSGVKIKQAAAKGDLVSAYTEANMAARNIKLAVQAADKSFMSDYESIISDRVITQFDSFAGTALPTYRLQSAITNDSWFMQQFRETAVAQKYQNFLIDFPLLFSKYCDTKIAKGDNNPVSLNTYYKGSTAYLVDFGNEYDSADICELAPSDQLHLLFLNNLSNLTAIEDEATTKEAEKTKNKLEPKNIFFFQPVCYSDKSSIGTKVLNLEAPIYYADDITGREYRSLKEIVSNFLTDPENVVRMLRRIDYKYRKNSQLILINSILEKWHKLAIAMDHAEEAKAFEPLTIEQLKLDRNGLTETLYNDIIQRYDALNMFLQGDPADATKNGVKADLSKYYWMATKLGIDLIDEVDYVKPKKGEIHINTAIRFDFTQLQTFDTFATSQEVEFQKMLNSPEFEGMRESMVDHLGNSLGASKYNRLLTGTKMFKRGFDQKTKKVVYNENYDTITDTLKVFSALSNLGRFAYLDLVSKQCYLDPDKKDASNAYLNRAHRIDAMAKRMVLYPATIQQYAQGKIDGVSQETKVAIINDPGEQTWNISGDTHGQDIYDGSGFESPFWSMMEDNSLPGHGIKGTKKTLGTSTRGQNSTLFKWAGFPISNEKMRFSMKLTENTADGKKAYQLARLFRKMHDIKFGEDIDITRSYLGTTLSSPGALLGRSIYIRDGFDFKRIVSLEKVDGQENTYIINYEFVDAKGNKLNRDNEPKTVVIDSIYNLWSALGGVNSYDLVDHEMQESEASIEATFEYIINVGEKTDAFNKADGLYTQKTIRQPLRDKFIAIAANKSAIKRGSCNLNSADEAWRSEKELNYMTINTSCFGVQLDANHHADLAEVREMSQTISALAALGYTSDLADQAYESIADLVRLSLTKVSKYLTKLEHKNIQEAVGDISRALVKALAKEDKIASVDAFIEMFSDQVNGTILPISDRRFYGLFIKEILGELNKSSIKRKYTGLGGVLNPASNIMQIFEFNGKQYLFPNLLQEAMASKEINSDEVLPEFVYGGAARTIKEYLQLKWADDLAKLYKQEEEIKQQLSALGDVNSLNADKKFEYYKTENDLLAVQSKIANFRNQQDVDVVNLYMALSESGTDRAQAKELFEHGRILRRIPQTSDLSAIKILDTVQITVLNPKDGKIETKRMCLDTDSKMKEFWKLVEDNWDYERAVPKEGFSVALCLNEPHDLRPQYVSWKSKHERGTRVGNIYTTKAARLAGTLSGINDLKTKTDIYLTDLATDGHDLKEECK